MMRCSILLIVTLALASSAAGQAKTLDSYRLSWELLPTGYLEPVVTNKFYESVNFDNISDEELLRGARESDSFALAYVLILKKRGLVSRIPAHRTCNAVDAEFGVLRIRVSYQKTPSGFEKTVEYPNNEHQRDRVSSAAEQALEVVKVDHIPGLDRDGIVPSETPMLSPNSRLRVKVVQHGLFAVLKACELPAEASSVAETRRTHFDADRLLDDDWLAYHLWLSGIYCPKSQRVEGTLDGFDINANGVIAKLRRKADVWEVDYPRLRRDQAAVIEFWATYFDN